MNPSTAQGRVLVDQLIRSGVREAVLSPGSRSAPLAFALHAADAAGRLRLHVRVDERSAGFLALGLAKASGRPAAVVTTSGTATANLHPAVLEASYSDVPMLVLTADRPPELRGIGANQTIDQAHLYGRAVRAFFEVGVAEERPGQVGYWRWTAARAVRGAADGPVHLNVPLREPLVPDADDHWPEPLDTGVPEHPAAQVVRHEHVVETLPARGVVVLADGAGPLAADAVQLAEQLGWPVLSEPTVRLPDATANVPAGTLLAADEAFRAAHRPDLALVIGRPTLSRGIHALLREAADHWVVDPSGRWPDPTRTARRFLRAVPAAASGEPSSAWGDDWLDTGRRATAAVDALLDELGLSEPRTARDLVAALPAGGLLLVGSSRPIRDVDAFASRRADLGVLANRGVAGIDGTVSTAVGCALAHGGPAYALLGDLTFLHDANGLVLGPDEPRPDLCIVVVNNDGGGIFGLLEPGGPAHAASFERIFATPHGVHLAAVCAATSTPYDAVGSPDELAAALQPRPGIRVVEVRTNREQTRALHRRVAAEVTRATGR